MPNCAYPPCGKWFELKPSDPPERAYCCRTCGARGNALLRRQGGVIKQSRWLHRAVEGRGRSGRVKKGFQE